MMKAMIRRLALLLPPVRRFHAFAMRQAELNVESQAYILELNDRAWAAEARCTSEQDKAGRMLADERARSEEALKAERSHAAELVARIEALDLEIYMLRSDLHRAAERNGLLAGELVALRDHVKSR